MITDPRQIRLNKKWFREWLELHSDSEDDDYKKHAADILETWLNEKMPKLRIGNLFQFDNLKEYDSRKETIVSSPSFQEVNSKDSRGRPNAALNHYGKYLASFSTGELRMKLNAKYPPSARRVIGGTFKKRN